MSYPSSHDSLSRPTRYRSTDQPGYAYTMATSFNNGLSRPLLRQHPTEVYQLGHTQKMAAINRCEQFPPHQHSELSQHNSTSSVNTGHRDHWLSQMPLFTENCEESPELVHMKATRLASELRMAEPFQLKTIDQLYDEAMESEDEKKRKELKHEWRDLRRVQRSTTRAQPRPLPRPTTGKPQDRPLTQWPVFQMNHPVYMSPSNELHRGPGRLKMDVLARKGDNISHQASKSPQATNASQAVNTLGPQLFRDLLTGSTAWRDKESTANVEYHEFLRDSALLANKGRKRE